VIPKHIAIVRTLDSSDVAGLAVDVFYILLPPQPGATGAKRQFLLLPPPMYAIRFIASNKYSGLTFASEDEALGYLAARVREAEALFHAKKVLSNATESSRALAEQARQKARETIDASHEVLHAEILTRNVLLLRRHARMASRAEWEAVIQTKYSAPVPGSPSPRHRRP
jgi:hypothetical protein